VSESPADPFAAAGLRPRSVARLLAIDSGLAAGLAGDEQARAAEQAWARVVELAPGAVALPVEPEPFAGWFGLLVLDGFLVRNVEVGRAAWPELLGRGDLMRPWTTSGDLLSSIPARSRFEVVSRSRLALLDRAFARRVAPWPEIAAALLDRTVERSHWLASHLAAGQPSLIDERVWMVLWHLADRWGVVSADGVELRLPNLSHRVLAAMLGARRPTVSLATRRLAERGLLTHRPRERWTLHGGPDAFAAARPPLAPAGRGR